MLPLALLSNANTGNNRTLLAAVIIVTDDNREKPSSSDLVKGTAEEATAS